MGPTPVTSMTLRERLDGVERHSALFAAVGRRLDASGRAGTTARAIAEQTGFPLEDVTKYLWQLVECGIAETDGAGFTLRPDSEPWWLPDVDLDAINRRQAEIEHALGRLQRLAERGHRVAREFNAYIEEYSDLELLRYRRRAEA